MNKNEILCSKIVQSIKKSVDKIDAYEDLFSVLRDIYPTSPKTAFKFNSRMRELLTVAMPITEDPDAFYDMYKRSLLLDAPYDFDSYLLYLEINREPSKRFYQPRRKVMKQVVDALQKLTDGELDELFLSMPPRVGKTTILLFYITWLIGKDSELANLYSAYSNIITEAMYNGVMEVINDPTTYLWHDVFPDCTIASTNAKDGTLNIDRRKRYPSLTCRSLYATLNGACDCNGILISDDLIGGIEEALSPDRLRNAWYKVDNNLLPRAKQGAKILWCGTRWSIYDPTGTRMDLLLNDQRYKTRRFQIINLPALNDNEESNFDYQYNVGFSTEYYVQRRASFERNGDVASWLAQYMGQPIEREGALFSPDAFRTYNGELPEGEPDLIFAPVDPAFGGGDFVACPIMYMYGDDIYFHDVVYDNGDKAVTQPMVARAVVKNNVQRLQFEANKSTESYKEGVQKLLKGYAYKCNVTSKPAPSTKSKAERIFDKAPDIRESVIIREEGCRTKEYQQFLNNVWSFKVFGKNKNDDAPDSLAMAMDMVHRSAREVQAFKRLF